MKKYRIKKETNSITKKVRYRIQEKFLWIFWVNSHWFEVNFDLGFLWHSGPAIADTKEKLEEIINEWNKKGSWI